MEELIKYKKDVTSQWGEDGIITEIFKRIGTENPLCVEFGAWDGKKYSNTWNLWNNENWSAVLIEKKEERFLELFKNTKEFKKVTTVNKNVEIEGNNSLDNILSEIIIKGQSIDLISIDIDGDDYYIFQSLKNNLPRVVIIEHNPTIPENINLVQKKGEYLGASALALCKLAEEKGYSLITMTDTNCFFIKNEEFDKLEIEHPSVKDVFIDSHITYLMSNFDGLAFLNRVPPYFKDRIRHFKLMSPKTKDLNNFVPVIFSMDEKPEYIFFLRKIKLSLKSFIKKILPDIIVDYIRNKKPIISWYLKNKPLPPSHFLKEQIVKNYAKKYKIKTFIETGTYKGIMLSAVKDIFEKLYSIELNATSFQNALIKFREDKQIKLLNGDSGKIMINVLKDINEPCLFWLDGHYSGKSTSKGEKNTPILQELKTILNHKIKNHIILIDDARLFTGKNDYPTIKELKYFVKNLNNNLRLKVKYDIVRIISPK
ncbi:FkbM family methyltransferase [Patescibacteria group bacterium]|nr:FkbM family methyltransferase [Patescibacteria group bacterium]